MSDKTKIIAFYLPQFHNIPENDEWWGDGFTEWVNVKAAVPHFEGHVQPRRPLDDNYYNLLNDDVKIWQAQIAKEYGVDAFCYYHYWFNGKMLLEKPMEQMLANKEVDIPFCISWANEAWTKAWVNEESKVLIAQKYGEEKEWKEHYDYLKQFFLDDRYIKVDNKPMFIIYRPEVITCLEEMLKCWNELAIKDGFSGILIYSQAYTDLHNREKLKDVLDGFINYQPSFAINKLNAKKDNKIRSKAKGLFHRLNDTIERITGIELRKVLRKGQKNKLKLYQFDDVWKEILASGYDKEKDILGAFPSWDNTPRHKDNGLVVLESTPDKFSKYLAELIKIADAQKNKYIFVNAWNEWAETAVLEPDEHNKYGYLEAIKQAKETY